MNQEQEREDRRGNTVSAVPILGDPHIRCRLKKGWRMDCIAEGCAGDLYAVVNLGGQRWAVVRFDDRDDPDLVKAVGIEVMEPQWKDL